MITSYFLPRNNYTDRNGKPVTRFTNETIHDILRRWKQQVKEKQYRDSQQSHAGLGYDPVTKTWY